MVENKRPGTLNAFREAYLKDLSQRAEGGDSIAMETLSKIALGGHELARELIRQLDGVHPQMIEPSVPQKLSAQDYLFIAAHPVLCLRVARRQAMVAIEHEAPPANSTYEDFPNLTVVQAAKLTIEEENKRRQIFAGGVPKWAWSEEDQRRMEKGELPKGHPEHPNV